MDSGCPDNEDRAAPSSPRSYTRKPLSCSTCRLKKIRCDKRMPCCHCVKANLQCTFPSQRKPRERKPHLKNRPVAPVEANNDGQDGQDDGLVNRLQSLEAQVSSLRLQLGEAKAEHAASPKYDLVKRTPWSPRASSTGGVSHIKSSFWMSINFELQRQLTMPRPNGFGIQFEYAALTATSLPEQPRPDVSMLLFRSFQGLQQPLHHPPETHIMLFWQVFKDNVDPMIKVLHMPTLYNLFKRALWHRETLSIAEHALMFSIYYVSAAAMNEDMVLREFSVSKANLLGRMRVLVEQALVAAKFATTLDLTVMQALMFFVLVLRKTGEARSAGGLVGLVVHLSHSFRLHKDGAGINGITPFQREMRRRLFWCVIVLDQRSAEDLGTDPMIPEEMWNTPLPLNINDNDFSESSAALPAPRQGITDMAFVLLRLHTLQTSARVRRLATEESDYTIEMIDQLCEEMWQETEDMIQAQFFDVGPNHEFSWAARHMASLLISKMKLTDQCSFYSPENTDMTTETMHSRSTAHLASAIRVIEENHSANMDQRWAKWKWIFVAYSRWHGSAILFKEMLRRQWTPISEQAWETLHKIMGDSKLGELECLRDQPVMPLPFAFIYDLTKNYRESEFARLRADPDEAQRLCDEVTVRIEDSDGGGGKTSGDRPGVSVSSLERWRWSTGLARTSVSHISVSPPPPVSAVSRGVFLATGATATATAMAETSLVNYSATSMGGYTEAQTCNNIPPTLADQSNYGLGMQQMQLQQQQQRQWDVCDAMPVEYMENILDELF